MFSELSEHYVHNRPFNTWVNTSLNLSGGGDVKTLNLTQFLLKQDAGVGQNSAMVHLKPQTTGISVKE